MTAENKLVFGQIPEEEASFRRRSQAARIKPPENQAIYEYFQAVPLIEKVLKFDWRHWQEEEKQKRTQQQEILEAIYGQGVEVHQQRIHPSTASFCVRWAAYRALEFPETEPTVKSILAMKMGSAIHWSLSRIVKNYLPGEAEASFEVDDPDVAGRIDFLFPHPRLKGQYQVWEFKSVSDYVFRQIKRKGLPDYLRNTLQIYQPLPEHRQQTLLYMWGKRSQGFNVVCGNIIYINRNNGEMKEALIPWDELARYDVEGDDPERCLVLQIKEAQVKIEKLRKLKQSGVSINEEEIPQPTVESSHVCARFCPHRVHCSFGQKYAAGEVRRQIKRRPQYVYRKLKQEAQVTRELMEKAGLAQSQLPIFQDLLKPTHGALKRETIAPKPTYNLNKELVLKVCCECGANLRQNCRLIKDRVRKPHIAVEKKCPHCGVIDYREISVLRSQLEGLPEQAY